jgi:hypothetical protein
MFETESGILLTATAWTGRVGQRVSQLMHRRAVG